MRGTSVVVALLLVLASCGGDSPGNEAFCDATRTVVELEDVEEVPPEVDVMVEEAPDEIRDAAERIREGFERTFENEDLSELEKPEFQEAATELREYALDNCEGLTDETD